MKTNIAELLKDCPKGMEFDCLLFGEPVTYINVHNGGTYQIVIKTSSGEQFYLTKEGYLYDKDDSKCILFPKGKTTWEGFIPPCKFKDGDVVICNYGDIHLLRTENSSYCAYRHNRETKLDIILTTSITVVRLATEEEKEKLFKAIKDNGYRWNFQAKRLEKLIIPNFKKGDKVRVKNGVSEPRIIDDVCDTFYTLVPIGTIDFTDQDRWELVSNKFDITTLTPFESKVLVRYNKESKWCPAVWGFYDYEKGLPHRYAIVGGITFAYCIPYKGNERLLGKTDDCDDYYKTWE